MKNHLLLTGFASACLFALGALSTPAQVITYDFSTVSGEYTSPTTTVGIATFSSPYDSANQIPNTAGTTGPTGEFQFGPSGGLFSNFTSNDVLSSAGYVGAGVESGTPYSPAVLDISFSQAQSAVSFDFATSDFFDFDGGDYLTLTTNTGQTATFNASVPGTDFYPEGSVNFTGTTPFTSITVRTYDNAGDQDLVLADLTSTTATTTPEPPTCALLIAGGLFLILAIRRRSLV